MNNNDMSKFTHLDGKWDKRTRQWTYWTIWDPTISDMISAVTDTGYIPISKSSFQDIFTKSVKKLCHSFRGLEDDYFMIVLKDIEFPSCSNKILHSKKSFIYSRISDRIEMNNIEFISFFGGKSIRRIDKSPKTLCAFSSLAQLLAAKIEMDDIFIISGNGWSISENKAEIELNGSSNEFETWVDVIHFKLNISDEIQKVHMIEKILPDERLQDLFQFTYSSCHKKYGKYNYKDITVNRTFQLFDDSEQIDDKPFKMPISGNPNDALMVYKAMRGSTTQITNFENELIDVTNNNVYHTAFVRNKIDTRTTHPWSSFIQSMLAGGVFLVIYFFYQMDPFWIHFAGECLELSEN